MKINQYDGYSEFARHSFSLGSYSRPGSATLAATGTYRVFRPWHRLGSTEYDDTLYFNQGPSVDRYRSVEHEKLTGDLYNLLPKYPLKNGERSVFNGTPFRDIMIILGKTNRVVQTPWFGTLSDGMVSWVYGVLSDRQDRYAIVHAQVQYQPKYERTAAWITCWGVAFPDMKFDLSGHVTSSAFREYSLPVTFLEADGIVDPSALINAPILLESAARGARSKGKAYKQSFQKLLGTTNWAFKPPPQNAFRKFLPPSPQWGRMAREAYENVGLWDGNGIALVKDLRDLKSSAASTVKTVKALKGKGKLALVAKLFLSFHYGWKLLASDLSDLCQAISDYQRRSSPSRVQATESVVDRRGWVTDYRYQCYYDLLGRVQVDAQTLMSMLDLNLTLENMWDLVPYSFVVDWFVDISDLCASIDDYFMFTQQHDVIAAGCSQKTTGWPSPDILSMRGLWGDLQYSYYSRTYSSDPVEPLYELHSNLSTLPNHIVEAGALIVSRR